MRPAEVQAAQTEWGRTATCSSVGRQPWPWSRSRGLPGPLPDRLPGLVAAYAFDDGSGSVLSDASGNGHDGTISGATWTSGHDGGALSFNGSNASVDLGSLGTFYQSGFTLEGLGAEADEHEERRRRARQLVLRAAARCSGSTISPATTS